MLPLRDVNPTRARPIITWAVIVGCAVVFFALQPPSGSQEEIEFLYERAAIACELTTGTPLDLDEINGEFCLNEPGDPYFSDKNIWLAAGVSMFLHGGIAHLLFNMWSLWIFGNNVEEAFGHVGYVIFYLAAGVAATVGFVAVNPDLTVPLIGASGAIAGVMGAYVVLFPRHLILTIIFFFVTAVPAIVFLGFWFVSQFAIAGSETGIAWEAHVAGFIFGVIVTLPFRQRLLANTLSGDRPQRTGRLAR